MIGAIKDRMRGGRVLDVGAGTGILSGQLTRAGLDVVAVDPLPEMVKQLRLSLPAVPVAIGVAESLPFRTGFLDGLCVGQAFHWFDARAALAEAARVLRPGGTLALVWNVRDESVAWVGALDELVAERTGGRPYTDHRETPWSEVVATNGGFTEVGDELRVPNPVPASVDAVIDRLRSTSFVAALDDGPRSSLLEAARELLTGTFGLEGRFEYPHHTVVWMWERA